MGANTKIEWADHTLNFWMGCDPVSEGCANCYAKRHWRLHGMKPGERRAVSEKTIQATLRKAKAGDFVFVNSLSDFFDPAGAPWRAHALDVMLSRPDLRFLLLTKRPERIAEDVCGAGSGITHIWIGVTAENQARALERGSVLASINWPGKKFVSMEPLLGPVDTQIGCGRGVGELLVECVDQIIVGGESGPNARPMNPKWVRSVRDQCVEAGVPFFFKQWGGVNKKAAGRLLDGREWSERPEAGK